MAEKTRKEMTKQKQPRMWVDPLTGRVWRVVAIYPDTQSVVWRADDYRRSDLPSYGYGYTNNTGFVYDKSEEHAHKMAQY